MCTRLAKQKHRICLCSAKIGPTARLQRSSSRQPRLSADRQLPRLLRAPNRKKLVKPWSPPSAWNWNVNLDCKMLTNLATTPSAACRRCGIRTAPLIRTWTSILPPEGSTRADIRPSGRCNSNICTAEVLTRCVSRDSDTEKRLPGNGASTSDPEDESKKVNNHPSYTTPLDVTAEPPVVPPVMERTVPMGKSDGESDDKTPASHKTPKLSRFFGKNKRSKSPAVSSKRTAATSMSNGSPTLGKSVTAINSSPAKHSSPKTDKRSSSKCRDPLTGKSPSKSTSKSPARNECAVPASPKSRSSVSKSANGKNSSSSALLSHRSPKKDASKLNWVRFNCIRIYANFG